MYGATTRPAGRRCAPRHHTTHHRQDEAALRDTDATAVLSVIMVTNAKSAVSFAEFAVEISMPPKFDYRLGRWKNFQ